MKNGRHLGGFRRVLAALVTTALLASPVTAFAQDPAGDDDDDAAAARLQAVAEKAIQEALKKVRGKEKEKEKPEAKAEKAPLPAADKDKKEKELGVEERALRGVVTLERGGQVVGLGAVLAGDGRILTALSPLGAGNDLEARLADGSTVRVKLGHHDRMWDLALVVPQTGKWPEGLTASSRDPVRPDAAIRSYTPRGGKPATSTMALRTRRTLIGGDDKALENAIEIGSRVTPNDLGSPIVDEEGRVVGVLGRACAPNEGGRPCTPVAYGIPMSAIKGFLRSVPATAVAPSAWLGIQGVGETASVARGVRVLVVHPESPAEEAKLRGGDKSVSDTILAVDGVPVTSPETLSDVIRTHAVGQKVPLVVYGQGKYRTVTVLLRAAPDATPSRPGAAAAHPAELPPLSEAAPPRAGGATPAAPAAPQKPRSRAEIPLPPAR